MDNLNKFFEYSGYIPTELYSKFGFLMGLMDILLNKKSDTLSFLVLPQLISFSLVRLIRDTLERYELDDYFDPSTTITVNFSLLVSMGCQLFLTKKSSLFGLEINNIYLKYLIIGFLSIITIFSCGYLLIDDKDTQGHNLLHLIFGIIVGSVIGFMSWHTITKKNENLKDDFQSEKMNSFITIIKTLISIIIIILIVENIYNTFAENDLENIDKEEILNQKKPIGVREYF